MCQVLLTREGAENVIWKSSRLIYALNGARIKPTNCPGKVVEAYGLQNAVFLFQQTLSRWSSRMSTVIPGRNWVKVNGSSHHHPLRIPVDITRRCATYCWAGNTSSPGPHASYSYGPSSTRHPAEKALFPDLVGLSKDWLIFEAIYPGRRSRYNLISTFPDSS